MLFAGAGSWELDANAVLMPFDPSTDPIPPQILPVYAQRYISPAKPKIVAEKPGFGSAACCKESLSCNSWIQSLLEAGTTAQGRFL